MKYKAMAGITMAAICIYGANANANSQNTDHPFYIGGNGDVDFPSDSDVKGATTGTVKYTLSTGGSLALGYEPPSLNTEAGDVRAELEAGYHAFGLDSVKAAGVTNKNPSSDLKAVTLMANAYYDIHTSSQFTPYIGAGIGEGRLQFPTGKGLTNTDSTDNALAYQGMAGVSYTPESMPRADFSLGYRYLGFDKPSFQATGGDVKLSPLHENDVEFGFRYHF